MIISTDNQSTLRNSVGLQGPLRTQVIDADTQTISLCICSVITDIASQMREAESILTFIALFALSSVCSASSTNRSVILFH